MEMNSESETTSFNENDEFREFNEVLRNIRESISCSFESEEEFIVNTKDIFNTHATKFNASSVLPEPTFLKYLSEIPVFVAEKIFNSFKKENNKYLNEEDFTQNLYRIRYSVGKELIMSIFKILDFDSDGLVYFKDMKVMCYLMYPKIKSLRKAGNLTVDSEQMMDEVILRPFYHSQSLSFGGFLELINKEPKLNICLYVFMFIYSSLPIYRNLLLLYKVKSQHYQRAARLQKEVVILENNGKAKNNGEVEKYEFNSRKSTTTEENSQKEAETDSFKNECSCSNCSKGGAYLLHNCERLKGIFKQKLTTDLFYSSDKNSSANCISTFQDLEVEVTLEKTEKTKDELERELSLLEEKIRGEISLEDEVFLTEEVCLTKDSFAQYSSIDKRYIILLDRVLYIYFLKGRLDTYFESRSLIGSFFRYNKKVKIDREVYASFTIFCQNGNNRSFFFKKTEDMCKWVNTMRACLDYRGLFEQYDLLKEIGVGGFGKVYEGEQKINKDLVAVKIIEKNQHYRNNWFRIKGEVDLMRMLKHPNIVGFIDYFENSSFGFIVMEYMPTGTLKKYLKDSDITESEAKRIIKQVCSGLQYLHGFGITHRDLKPDNILVSFSNEEINVKLADFGLGRILGQNEKITDRCGTKTFIAPEIHLKKFYDLSVDIWSLGVTIHYILTRECLSSIDYETNTVWISTKLNNFSKDAADLVMKCLSIDPVERLTIDEVLRHPWLC